MTQEIITVCLIHITQCTKAGNPKPIGLVTPHSKLVGNFGLKCHFVTICYPSVRSTNHFELVSLAPRPRAPFKFPPLERTALAEPAHALDEIPLGVLGPRSVNSRVGKSNI